MGTTKATLMSGVVHDHLSFTPEHPTNDWVKLCNNMCHQEHGIFRHCEIPIGFKNTHDLKMKLFNKFFPALTEEHEHLLKSKKQVLESCTIDRTAYEYCVKMVYSHRKSL